MKKQLLFLFIFTFFSTSMFIYGQDATHKHTMHYDDDDVHHKHTHEYEQEASDRQACNLYAVLLDVITSDEDTDFNCSGGFCMIKSHYHKKGLTTKRQWFDYFINISG